MKKLIIIIICISGYGCVTGYYQQTSSLYYDYKKGRAGGGYNHIQLNDNIFEVTFTGNNSTNPKRVEDLCLLRCAEICTSMGYTNFIILDKEDLVQQGEYTSPITTTTSGRSTLYGNSINSTAKSTTTGGKTRKVNVRHTKEFTITLTNNRNDGYKAKYLLDSISRKYALQLNN